MDILYLGKMFPKRASIMAKKELAWTPFLGWWSAYSLSLSWPHVLPSTESRPLKLIHPSVRLCLFAPPCVSHV